jgi:hypothetical protein
VKNQVNDIAVEQRLGALNPAGLSFDGHITDNSQLIVLFDRIAAVINAYGIDKIGCSVLDADDGLEIHLVCVKPEADLPDWVWASGANISAD